MFKEIFSEVLVTLIFAIFSYIVVYVRNQITEITKEKIKNEKVKQYIETANGIVEQAVLSVTQTYVDELKGKDLFSSEAQKTALQKAKDSANAMFNTDIVQTICDNYGDFDEWLATKIEETVSKNK